jgi:methylenetetrahydrofolate dehydrogenase (NADP+)/methenyltetrahydrofolate cyclohydrolase
VAAQILDGKAIAKQIQAELAQQVAEFAQDSDITPKLAAVLVGEDPASQVYVRNKHRACKRVGIASDVHRLSSSTGENELLSLIAKLNDDRAVSGILVQLPLPAQIGEKTVLDAIRPDKDVDAFHPENVGLLAQGRPRFLPCTPHGVQHLLHRSDIQTIGKHVVILGRSEIVGKPLGAMFVQRDSSLGPSAANATVTICHSRTVDLPAITSRADILVAAIGKANFVTAEMVKPGAVVVDVGINRTEDGLVGDVDFAAVSQVASHITPVPGGVGPLTIAMLLSNTLAAAQLASTAMH